MLAKPLAILFLSLAITETVIMVLFSEFSSEYLGPWLPSLFDASVVSLVAIGVITQLLKKRLIVLHRNARAEFIAFEIGIIVFIIEAIMMFALNLLPFTLNDWYAGVFDVAVLSSLSVIVIYFLLLKPAVNETQNKENDTVSFEPIIISSLFAYLCFAILLLMILFTSYQQQLEERKQELALKEVTELNAIKNEFLDRLNGASRDLLILANELDLQEFLHGSTHSTVELHNSYQNIIMFKDYYVQVRVLNTKGKELVRVQRNGEDIEVSSSQQLQDKSDRYYFKEAIQMAIGEVFISPLDLNVEQGIVEQPFNPMIRLATPIANSVGEKIGIIVINIRGNHLLNKLQSASKTFLGKKMLLNSDGYWLFGGENNDNWAFMFANNFSKRFEKKHPGIWQKIQNTQQGQIEINTNCFIFQTIEYSPALMNTESFPIGHAKIRHWPVWKLVSIIPATLIKDQLRPTKKLLIFLYCSFLVFAALGTIQLARAVNNRRKCEEEIRTLAFYDHLTGLCNRRLFSEIMEQEIARIRREPKGLALMYFDLDYFKVINDELGHDAGDLALKEAASRISNNLRDCDSVARLGGDEFAALLPNPGSTSDLTVIAERLIESFKQPFDLFGNERFLGISVGIAMQKDKNENSFSLIKRADHAMYEAKRSGRNDFRFSETDL